LEEAMWKRAEICEVKCDHGGLPARVRVRVKCDHDGLPARVRVRVIGSGEVGARRLACEHLDEHAADGPDVRWEGVTRLLDDLGGHPVGRALLGG
jgi:hypothetical protein